MRRWIFFEMSLGLCVLAMLEIELRESPKVIQFWFCFKCVFKCFYNGDCLSWLYRHRAFCWKFICYYIIVVYYCKSHIIFRFWGHSVDFHIVGVLRYCVLKLMDVYMWAGWVFRKFSKTGVNNIHKWCTRQEGESWDVRMFF